MTTNTAPAPKPRPVLSDNKARRTVVKLEAGHVVKRSTLRSPQSYARILAKTACAVLLMLLGGGLFACGYMTRSAEDLGDKGEGIEIDPIYVQGGDLSGPGLEEIMKTAAILAFNISGSAVVELGMPNKLLADLNYANMTLLNASTLGPHNSTNSTNEISVSAEELDVIFPETSITVGKFHTQLLSGSRRRLSEALDLNKSDTVSWDSTGVLNADVNVTLEVRRAASLGADDHVLEVNDSSLIPMDVVDGTSNDTSLSMEHYMCNTTSVDCTLEVADEHGRRLFWDKVWRWACSWVCKAVKKWTWERYVCKHTCNPRYVKKNWRWVYETGCGYVCGEIWEFGFQRVCEHICTKILAWVWVAVVSSCFPAEAQVHMLGHDGLALPVPISSIRPGEVVLTPSGFEAVYFITHADPSSVFNYMEVELDYGSKLKLSPDHFFKLADGSHVLAKDVRKGMTALVSNGGNDTCGLNVPIRARVLRVTSRLLTGAFNPLTMSGEIVVDGVHASCHSSWLLEESSLVSRSNIPAIYQAIFAPVRGIWTLAPALVESFCKKHAIGMDGLSTVDIARSVMQLSA